MSSRTHPDKECAVVVVVVVGMYELNAKRVDARGKYIGQFITRCICVDCFTRHTHTNTQKPTKVHPMQSIRTSLLGCVYVT